MKNLIITHDVDADGFASRYLFENIFGDSNVGYIGYNYGRVNLEGMSLPTPDDWFKLNTDNYIFGDVTPTDDFIQKIIDNQDNHNQYIYIFDHHKNRHDEIYEKFGEHINKDNSIIKYYFDNKYSASFIILNAIYTTIIKKLQYKDYPNYPEEFYNSFRKELFQTVLLHNIIKLVDYYDTWKFSELVNPEDKRFKNQVLSFSEYNKTYCTSYLKFKIELDKIMSYPDYLDSAFTVGDALIDKTKKDNNQAINNGRFYVNHVIDDLIFLYQGYPNYFLGEELKKDIPEIKAYMGYQINCRTNTVKLSIRTFGDVDAVAIAKYFDPIGGGGHKNASGATISLETFYELLMINPISNE